MTIESLLQHILDILKTHGVRNVGGSYSEQDLRRGERHIMSHHKNGF